MGCQMNVLDSELVLGQLRAMGYESISDMTRADVVLLIPFRPRLGTQFGPCPDLLYTTP